MKDDRCIASALIHVRLKCVWDGLNGSGQGSADESKSKHLHVEKKWLSRLFYGTATEPTTITL